MNRFAGILAPTEDQAPFRWQRMRQLGAAQVLVDRTPILFVGDETGGSLQFAALDIIGHVRLDNREQLQVALSAPPILRDLDLVAMAYLRWGTDAARHLEGDFAVAIFDRRAHVLVLLRDLFGVAPLYYRHEQHTLCFSSQQSDITDTDDQPDPQAMARFVIGLDDDAGGTMFAPVKRLPPGHLLRIPVHGAPDVRRFRELTPATVVSDGAVHELRTRLDAAVRRRMDHTGKSGALLSGGLDSSAICAFAARAQPGFAFPVYSFYYPPGTSHDESVHVRAMQHSRGLKVSSLPMHDFDPLLEIEPLLDPLADAVFAPGLGKLLRLYRQARADGVSTLLDGHGGDEVISHGVGLIAEYARSRHWLALWQVLHGIQNLYGQSRVKLFWQAVTAHSPLKRLRRSRRAGGSVAPMAFIHVDIRSSVADRARAWAEKFGSAQQAESTLHLWNVSNPGVARGFETLSRAAASQGVTLAFPFFDRGLVEAALAIPARDRVKHGFTRYPLRLALAGVLPDSVRWRRDKVDFSAELREGLVRHSALLHKASAPDGPLAGIVDAGVLTEQVNRLLAKPDRLDGTTSFILLRCAVLSMWLERRRTRSENLMGAAE